MRRMTNSHLHADLRGVLAYAGDVRVHDVRDRFAAGHHASLLRCWAYSMVAKPLINSSCANLPYHLSADFG